MGRGRRVPCQSAARREQKRVGPSLLLDQLYESCYSAYMNITRPVNRVSEQYLALYDQHSRSNQRGGAGLILAMAHLSPIFLKIGKFMIFPNPDFGFLDFPLARFKFDVMALNKHTVYPRTDS